MKNKDKIVKFRVNDSLLNSLKEEAKLRQMSISSYINFRLNSSIKKHEILFDELINKFEKKRLRFVFFLH
jgi:antitoxin component of RelBE/YafQ-DinJ toxin-antitoxin module